jgi:hypothetical protein
MKKILIIFSILTSYASYGAVDSLITNHVSWKYLDNGTNQGTGWSATGFNDVAWASGNTILGYGDLDTDLPTHQVGYGGNTQNRYITTYFRKSFNVVNPAAYSSLDLSLICDDGAVVYLNGTEIYRQGMPVGVIASSTLATASVGEPNERIWANVNFSTAQLLTGNNVIAIEIHQVAITSSDIAMNFLLAANIIPPSANDSLIVNHAAWKFLDNGTNQGTAWSATGFNDVSWASGNTILGYGDLDTDLPTHQVGYGGNTQNRYITTYFRKSFNVVNPASYISLSLSLICDDGAVVYLNGTEIYRQGMPVGAITSTTLATASVGEPNERVWTNVNVSSAQLLAGNNALAVEIHQVAITSSDIAMNLLLKGNVNAGPPTVTRGPYLQMLGTDRVVVRWQTATATDSKVSYGLTTSYLSPPVTSATSSTEHEILITGLTQDTKYFYQIGTTTANIPSDAQTFFKTALPAGTNTDFSVWATGDFGTGTTSQADVRNAYTTYATANLPNGKADFWLWLGDNAYEAGTASDFTLKLFNIYPTILKNTPVYPAVGNHDYANHGDNFPGALLPYPATYEYFNALTMPQNAELGGVASTTKRYYSYNYGNVHFIVLDSYGVVTNSTTNPMYVWLQADLAANTKKWTVCYFHHPPYSKGTHDSENPAEIGLIYMRQYFVPLLESYHVDLVLSGHSHVYERSFLLAGGLKVNTTLGDVSPYYTKSLVNGIGTVYAVCGNSGQGGVVSTAAGFPYTAVMARSFATLWGSMVLTFRTNEIEAKFLTSTGTINDSFKIVKNSCVAGVTVEESITSGDWHTTSTWGCGTIPTTDSMVQINTGHTVTLNTANTADLKKIYVFGMLRYLSNRQLRLKN